MTDNPWLRYYRVGLSHPDVLEAVETLLSSLSDGYETTVEDIVRNLAGGFNYDHVASVLAGLESLGLLCRVSLRVYRLDRRIFEASAPTRRQVRDALTWSKSQSISKSWELLLAMPGEMQGQIGMNHEKFFSDLRTAVRSLIVTAKRQLILASPFWDNEVAQDIGSLIDRRLAAGVEVIVLARRATTGTSSQEALFHLGSLGMDDKKCKLLILDRDSDRDPFGSCTFHFKAACADGERVYLGSANFNTAGFTSRWELGVLLQGSEAQLVSALLESLISIAQPLSTS